MDLSTYKNCAIQKIETSSKEQKYLISLENRYFEVSYSTMRLIELAKENRSLENICDIYNAEQNANHSVEIIELILQNIANKISAKKTTTTHKKFIIQRELIPADFVSKFSNNCKFLFNKYIMLSLMAIALVLEGIFFSGSLTIMNIYDIDFYVIGGVILFFILSSMLHELGHASACKYFGVDHGGIGFGLYFQFPVFYTDVSTVWKLSRNKRLIVNIAGTYFQFIMLIPLLAIFFITQSNIIKYFILAVNINFVITLNPFFKFDGYWIMSDMLGVPNLRERTNELFAYWFYKKKYTADGKKPFLVTMKKKEKILMVAYSVIMNLFFVFYICYLMPWFMINFFKTYPALFKDFIQKMSMGIIPDFKTIQVVVAQFLFFALTVFVLYQLVLSIVRRIRA